MFKREAKNWTVQGNLMVSFYDPGPIDDETWQDYCDTVASQQVLKVLATSVGAVEVSAPQRKSMSQALKTEPRVSVSVVTDEAIVRGLMIAVSWLGRVDVKAFPWHKVAAAYQHLGPSGINEKETLDLVDSVRRRVEGREEAS